jgi:hypothetical protein
MYICPKCGNKSVIQIADAFEIPFFSCYTEGCPLEAILLIDSGEQEFVEYNVALGALLKIVNEDEQTNNTESES